MGYGKYGGNCKNMSGITNVLYAITACGTQKPVKSVKERENEGSVTVMLAQWAHQTTRTTPSQWPVFFSNPKDAHA